MNKTQAEELVEAYYDGEKISNKRLADSMVRAYHRGQQSAIVRVGTYCIFVQFLLLASIVLNHLIEIDWVKGIVMPIGMFALAISTGLYLFRCLDHDADSFEMVTNELKDKLDKMIDENLV